MPGVVHSGSTTSAENLSFPSAQPSSTNRFKSRENVFKLGGSSGASTSNILMPHVSSEKNRKDSEGHCSSRVFDSFELIEREYVLVNRPSASLDSSSDCLDRSLQDSGTPNFLPRDVKGSFEAQRPLSDVSSPPPPPPPASGSYLLTEVQRLTIVHPPTKLQVLHQYAEALTEVAREIGNTGQVKESFAVMLVVLAVWTKALEICDSWMISVGEDTVNPNPTIAPETSVPDFSSPAVAKTWVTQEFVTALNQAENSSTQLNETSAATQMPDAMETIYEKALAYGKSGGAEEYLNNKESAATLYKKAILLLSFIIEEAVTLSLNPPFSLTLDDKNRILYYISNLQHRLSHL